MRCYSQAQGVAGLAERAQHLTGVDAVIVVGAKAIIVLAWKTKIALAVIIFQARKAPRADVKPKGAISHVALPPPGGVTVVAEVAVGISDVTRCNACSVWRYSILQDAGCAEAKLTRCTCVIQEKELHAVEAKELVPVKGRSGDIAARVHMGPDVP